MIKKRFIESIPGFLMAYVCATIGKVPIEVRVSLSICYICGMFGYLLCSMINMSWIADIFTAFSHASCIQLFFYSYVPQYSTLSGSFSESTAALVNSITSFFSKYIS